MVLRDNAFSRDNMTAVSATLKEEEDCCCRRLLPRGADSDRLFCSSLVEDSILLLHVLLLE